MILRRAGELAGTPWLWPAVLSIEIRKLLSYRVDFWVGFLGNLAVQFTVAYFLWRAVFAGNAGRSVGGLGFGGLVLYSLLAPLVGRMIRSNEMGFLSRDIYDGGLNRYLVFPVSLFAFKYCLHFAQTTLFGAQLLLVMAVAFALGRVPEGITLELPWVAAGVGCALLGTVLFFFMAACLEMVAFWVDRVWSLLIMLRFIIQFLGGALVPVSAFPGGLRQAAEFLPFYYLTGFPLMAMLGRLQAEEMARGLGMLCVWIAAFACLAWLVWQRGRSRYSGVGM